jgi:ADP-ribose pyrophosphatase YjhB (NUDIX family)
MTMITFDHGNVRFNYRVAAIIIKNGKVLLNQMGSNPEFWFPPGGRAELLETSEESLRREMREELGEEVLVERLLWIAETFFTLDNFHFQEIAMYYLVHLLEDSPLHNQDTTHHFQEGDMSCLCRWHDLNKLEDEIVLYPVFLREAVHCIPDSTRHIVMRENQLD